MAKKIKFPPQKLSVAELKKSIKGKIQKIIFQCRFVEIDKKDMPIIQIIAYAARKNGDSWEFGQQILSKPHKEGEEKTLEYPISFANMELSWAELLNSADWMEDEESVKAKTGSKKGEWLYFRPKVYPNPHVALDIDLDEAGAFGVSANPSPPAPPPQRVYG